MFIGSSRDDYAFAATLANRCCCWRPAAMLVPLRRATTWRLHSKSTSSYISHVKNWQTFIHWPILIFLFDGVRRWRVGMLNLFYILGPLMHNNMQGLLPGWTRKDIEQLPKVFFLYASIKMLNLLYFLEEFSHNNRPGSLHGWSRKGIEQLP